MRDKQRAKATLKLQYDSLLRPSNRGVLFSRHTISTAGGPGVLFRPPSIAFCALPGSTDPVLRLFLVAASPAPASHTGVEGSRGLLNSPPSFLCFTSELSCLSPSDRSIGALLSSHQSNSHPLVPSFLSPFYLLMHQLGYHDEREGQYEG